MSNKIFKKLIKESKKMQIIAFPYLGGHGNAFYELAQIISSNMELVAANPPGHGGSNLKLVESMEELLEIYYEELKYFLKEDFIFFGHSMGASVSYFLTQLMCRRTDYKYKPKALILSASSHPNKFAIQEYSKLSSGELIDKVISYGGVPEEVMKEKGLLEYLLPVFRADYKVLESVVNFPMDPIDIPVYLLFGEKDSTDIEQTTSIWKNYFVKAPKVAVVKDGGHMFIHEKVEEVARFIETVYAEVESNSQILQETQ